jgi:nitrate/TMAO reductase-like tetraheme cytochrome c subunit
VPQVARPGAFLLKLKEWARVSWEQLQDNWAILMGFVVGIVTWGKTVAVVNYTRQEQAKMGEQVGKMEDTISAIKESAARTSEAAESTARHVEMLIRRGLDK